MKNGRALFHFSALLLIAVFGRDFTLGCRPLQPDTIFAAGYLNGSSTAVAAACLIAPLLFLLSSYFIWWRCRRRVAALTLAAWAAWVLALTYLFVVSTNVWFDRSPAELHVSTIRLSSEEYHSCGRGHVGGTTAYLVFDSWSGPGLSALEVSSRPSGSGAAAISMELWVHRGFWRIPWVERCRFMTRPPPGAVAEIRCRFPSARFLPLWPP